MASAGLAGTTPLSQPAEDEQRGENGLGEAEPVIGADLLPGTCTFCLSGGLDFTNAYFRRGYLIEEGSPILQPYITGSLVLTPVAGLEVRPYVTVWDSANLRGLAESDQDVLEVMAGVFTTFGAAFFDFNYGYYSRLPIDSFTQMNELGGRLAYDLAKPWQTPGQCCTFSLRPSAAFYWEWMDQKNGGAGYVETGLEPAFRWTLCAHRLGVSFPMLLGLGVDGYYANNQGANATLGYFSAGLAGSVSLPTPPAWGQWYLNASLLYVRLLADNLIAINHGEADLLVGKLGIGFVF